MIKDSKQGLRIVLVISLCSKRLSDDEFVMPIQRAVVASSDGVECLLGHYTSVSEHDLKQSTHVILSGNPLMDHEFEKDTSFLSRIIAHGKPLLCICAGMQALALHYGLSLEKDEMIGMSVVTPLEENDLLFQESRAYFLHSKSAAGWEKCKSFKVVATSNKKTAIVKHNTNKVFGVLFHPEVRNQGIIKKFLDL